MNVKVLIEHFQEKHKSQSKIDSLSDMKVCICKLFFYIFMSKITSIILHPKHSLIIFKNVIYHFFY
jgi:hypothetical protein